MTAGARAIGSVCGVNCSRCGHLLKAPESVEDFKEEGVILSLWCCSNWGHLFATETPARVCASPKIASNEQQEPSASHVVA